MIKTDELKVIIFKRGMSQSEVARLIGIAPKTFYEKMDRGVFGSNEIEAMIDILRIDDPIAIFFARE